MTTGNRIKLRRIELKMTQDDLCVKLGYKDRTAIAKLESRDSIPARKLEKIAEALDVDVRYLLGIEPKTDDIKISREAIITHKILDDKEMIDFLEKYYNTKPEKQKAIMTTVNMMLD